MKKLFIYCTLILLPIFSFGQSLERQASKIVSSPLISTSKQSLFSEVDVIFNTRMAYDSYFVDGDHSISNFSLNQLRLEVKGKIHEKVFFRFRNRYTKIADPTTIDNLSRTVDMAYLVFDVAPQAKFSFGKMLGNFGGYELSLNPIDVLSYNNINNFGDLFLVGAAFSYALEDNKNTFNLQVLNARTKGFNEQYPAIVLPEGITASEVPLAFVGNWKGQFFNNKFQTTYSYTYATVAQDKMMNYVSLGNKLKLNKFVLMYDFQYSKEDLDHKGIVTTIIKNKYGLVAVNTAYLENWMRAEYQFRPKVSFLLSVMSSTAYWEGNPDTNKENALLTSYGIIPTIEYAPFTDMNLKFYVGYVSKINSYSTYAKDTFDISNKNAGQLSFGIIAPLLVL